MTLTFHRTAVTATTTSSIDDTGGDKVCKLSSDSSIYRPVSDQHRQMKK